jgi:hypothetical protein
MTRIIWQAKRARCLGSLCWRRCLHLRMHRTCQTKPICTRRTERSRSCSGRICAETCRADQGAYQARLLRRGRLSSCNSGLHGADRRSHGNRDGQVGPTEYPRRVLSNAIQTRHCRHGAFVGPEFGQLTIFHFGEQRQSAILTRSSRCSLRVKAAARSADSSRRSSCRRESGAVRRLEFDRGLVAGAYPHVWSRVRKAIERHSRGPEMAILSGA